jgi:hypothetical protein
VRHQGLPELHVVSLVRVARFAYAHRDRDLAKTYLSTRSTASFPILVPFSYLNVCVDFCLWAPPYSDGHNSSVGQVEEIMVAWCLNDGYGTRLIPDGTIKVGHNLVFHVSKLNVFRRARTLFKRPTMFKSLAGVTLPR